MNQAMNITITQNRTYPKSRKPDKRIGFCFYWITKIQTNNLSRKKLQVLWLRVLTEICEHRAEIPAEFVNQNEDLIDLV